MELTPSPETVAIFILSLLLGIPSLILIVSGLRKIINARKTSDSHRREPLGEQRIMNLTATLSQQDLANMIAHTQQTFTFGGGGILCPEERKVPKKEWVTPNIVEESTLEFTGIRAIQL